MSAEKLTRKELLKSEDEFLTLSARAAHFVQEHVNQFKYLGIAVGVVLLVYLGIQTYTNHVDKKGQAAYNEAFYALGELSRGKPDPEKLKRQEELFRKVTDQYGMADVSKLVYPELAFLKFQEKKYDEAVSLYQQFLKEAPKTGPYTSMAMLALAVCHEQKGEMEKAVGMLQGVLSDPGSPFKEQAAFHLARVYRLTGQQEKAKETLKDFVARYKDSPFLPMAKAYLKGYNS